MFGNGESAIGSQRTLTCYQGYQLEGNGNIRCNEGGLWSTTGRCSPIGRCFNIPIIANGIVTGGGDQVHASRNIECNPGYEITGSRTIYCQESRQWTAPGVCRKSKSRLDFVVIKRKLCL